MSQPCGGGGGGVSQNRLRVTQGSIKYVLCKVLRSRPAELERCRQYPLLPEQAAFTPSLAQAVRIEEEASALAEEAGVPRGAG